jgi:outer membrane immunogenic protein
VKKSLIGIAAMAATIGTSALAADIPLKAPPLFAPPAYSWTGCYVGGNTGGAWSDLNTIETLHGVSTTPNPLGAVTTSGWAYGGQIGCDYQFNSNWVVGIRGMWDGANLTANNVWPTIPSDTGDYRVDSFATAVGTVGFLLTPTLQLYALGGGAWVHDSTNWNNIGPFGIGEFATGDHTAVGYDVGVGVSWLFAQNWNAWIEYDHMGFGTKNFSLIGVGDEAGAVYGASASQSLDKVLVGIDYRLTLFVTR